MCSGILANVTSFIAMVLIASSYFFNRKNKYLFFQVAGILFLVLSYLFSFEYVAMLGVSVALVRTLVFFVYEQKEKQAPFVWSVMFCFATFVAYIVCVKLNDGKTNRLDTLYVVALCLYAFVFRIKNIKTVRLMCLLPTTMCVIYNIFIGAPVFSALSYLFELLANIVSIAVYYYATNIKISDEHKNYRNSKEK